MPPSCCMGSSGLKLLQPVNISFNINSKSLEIQPGTWLAAFWLCLGAQIAYRTTSKISPQLFSQGRRTKRGKNRAQLCFTAALFPLSPMLPSLKSPVLPSQSKTAVNFSKAFSLRTFLGVLPGQLKQYKSLEKNLTTKELGVLIAEGEQAGGRFFRNSCSPCSS